MNATHPHHIATIKVMRLFGRYTYMLPGINQALSSLNILYGDNGAGKTTLLRLVFDLLSPSDSKGHKTAISHVPFELLVVTLADGTVLQAAKDPQLLVGPTVFSITPIGKKSTTYNFSPNPDPVGLEDAAVPDGIDLTRLPARYRESAKRILERRAFFTALADISISTFMLTADRMLMGDSVLDNSRESTRAELSRRKSLSLILAEQRTASVNAAIETATEMIAMQVLDQSYANESSAKIYEEVIRKIVSTPTRTKQGLNAAALKATIEGIRDRIAAINGRLKQYKRFGFGNRTLSPELVALIGEQSGNKLILIEEVLLPYLAAQEKDLDDFLPIYELVDRLVSNINRFFKGKELGYSKRKGFEIFLDAGERRQTISPAQLSSGEQQLILLFFNVIVARTRASVFIIDEPEISLNVMWQRKLIDALQELAVDAEFQFLFASHSMEIIAKHRFAVISMKGVVNG